MLRLDRRRFLDGVLGAATVAGTAAVLPSARAAIPARDFHIFMVLGRGESDNEFGFRDYLSRRGMRVHYTVRNTGGDSSLLPGILDEIRSERPDLIYTWGTPQTRGIVGPYDDPNPQRYIRDIPVVFTYVAAPLDARIVADLQRPGQNTTGTVHVAPVAVQLNTILAYRPVRRIGVVFNPRERNSVITVEALRAEANARGVVVVEEAVTMTDAGTPDVDSLPVLIANIARSGAEMLYIGPDTFVASLNRGLVAAEAMKNRLPTFSVTEPIVRMDGAMLALASSGYGIGRFTAFKASRILLDGIPPGDIPVETLKRFSVIINMAAVRALQYYPPIGLLNFAEVIDR